MSKFVLGITGGVGSGKSTVLNYLERERQALVIQADLVARELMEPGQSSYQVVVKEFGEGILVREDSMNSEAVPEMNSESALKMNSEAIRESAAAKADAAPIDRVKLGQIVFNDEEKLKKLNALTHPLVKAEVQRRIREAKESLVVYEAALPAEAYMSELCDQVWFVHVPVEIRIERLMASRGYTEEKCRAIMANQYSDEAFTKLSDQVIENGGSTEETEKQLKKLLVSVI